MGRIHSRRHDKEADMRQKAEQLLAKSWLLKVKMESTFAVSVLSEFGNEEYRVAPAELHCTCVHSQVGGRICKHLHLCFFVSQQNPNIVQTIENLKKSTKYDILQNKLYEVKNFELGEEVAVNSPVTEQKYIVKLTSNFCTCNAFVHKGECFC